jgi:hypothetical protein
MRRIWLTEEDYRVLKSFIAISVTNYGKAFTDGRISKEDYHSMDKFLGRFYAAKKLRSRYDMTKTERYKETHGS